MANWYTTAYGLEIQKDPGSTRDYSLSWVDQLASGVTLTAVSHTVPAGMTKVAESVNSSAITDALGRVHPIGSVTTVRLQGGTAAERYTIVAAATFSTSETDERTFYVNVEQL